MRVTAWAALAVSTAILAPYTAAAQDLSDAQKNAVNHIAQVLAAESFCPRYQVNAAGVALVAKTYRIDLGSSYIRNVTTLLVRDHQRGLKAAGQNAGCLVAYGLYGLGGENVPNLLIRR